MRDKEPQFTVTDRRKFTAEGELREETASESSAPPAVAERAKPPASPQAVAAATQAVHAGLDEPDALATDDEEIIPEPTAAESAQQRQDYHASARRLDDMFLKANPGQPAVPAMNFDRLVQSLYMTAASADGRRLCTQRATPHRHPGGAAKH